MANNFLIPPIGTTLPIPNTGDLKFPTFIPSAQLAAQFLYKTGTEDEDSAEFTSYLGTPIYSNLIFEADSNNPNLSPKNTLGQIGNQPDGSLRIDTVLMNVTQAKNIVATPILGRSGTIKEYIALGDFDIQITGAIVSPNPLVYPKDDINALIKFLNLPQALPVTSQFLNFFGISSIVVTDYQIGEKMGSRNEVPFNIMAISDLDGSVDTTGFSWTTK